MPTYRRLHLPGASYFFTVNLADRRASLLTDRIADLRRAYAETVASAPVICDAMVVLPDHLHAIWTLPPGDSDYPERWRKIEHRFTRAVGAEVGKLPTLVSSICVSVDGGRRDPDPPLGLEPVT